jgi:hypothetical protein
MNDRFHALILDACGNRALQRAVALNDKLPFAPASAMLPMQGTVTLDGTPINAAALTRWSRRARWPALRPSHRAPGPARSSRPARCAWAARKPRICSRCSTRRTARCAASTPAWPSSHALHPGRWGQDAVHAGDLVHARTGAHQRPGGHGVGHLLHHPRPRREDLVRRPLLHLAGRGAGQGSNKAIQSYNDLAGKKVATQAGSTGPAILAQHAPKAVVQEFQTHQEALDALRQGRVDAYVTDHTLLLNALSLGAGDMKLAGAPFGAQDPYGIGSAQGLGRRGLRQCLSEEGGSRWHLGQAVDDRHRPAHRQHGVPTPPALP